MVTLAKVPTSVGSLKRNNGCEKAPEEIVRQLEEIFTKESGFKPSFNVIEIKTNNHNPDETQKNILNSEADIYIGGDHSITYSAFQTLKTRNTALIILDAHPDLDTTTDTPTHEDYLRKLIEENKLKPQNLILIGIRNYGENELEFIRENKIKHYTSKQISEYGINDIADTITEIANQFENIYLSIDIDIVDPSAAPGTGCPEPCGLTSRDALYLIQRINSTKKIRKADVVEVNPEKDLNNITSRLAARMIMELI